MNKNFEGFSVANAPIADEEHVAAASNDDAVEAQRQLVYKLSQERAAQEERHVNTPQMIEANERALGKPGDEEYSNYSFKRDIYEKAHELFGASSGGFLKDLDRYLGYSVMKTDVSKIHGHEEIKKENVKAGLLSLLEGTTDEEAKDSHYDVPAHAKFGPASISPYDTEKIETFRNFIKELD